MNSINRSRIGEFRAACISENLDLGAMEGRSPSVSSKPMAALSNDEQLFERQSTGNNITLTNGMTATKDETFEPNIERPDGSNETQKLGTALSLGICYSATCGGIATLTGTGPNLILQGNVNT
ncbi:unnamed protein product [Protopolystoma xenopodis]|uniref:Uncharacterized protein n=1 Tax=Protopolystoma xenopodis TaxID=117903 RepID=A0A448WRF0_9PLAT|nr:unnamed protein product [Protopolystoma xenopodis]